MQIGDSSWYYLFLLVDDSKETRQALDIGFRDKCGEAVRLGADL